MSDNSFLSANEYSAKNSGVQVLTDKILHSDSIKREVLFFFPFSLDVLTVYLRILFKVPVICTCLENPGNRANIPGLKSGNDSLAAKVDLQHTRIEQNRLSAPAWLYKKQSSGEQIRRSFFTTSITRLFRMKPPSRSGSLPPSTA